MKALDEADVYRRVIELSDKDAEMHYKLGVLLFNDRRLPEAGDCIVNALQLKPDHVRAAARGVRLRAMQNVVAQDAPEDAPEAEPYQEQEEEEEPWGVSLVNQLMKQGDNGSGKKCLCSPTASSTRRS